jgi:hypothetical protein
MKARKTIAFFLLTAFFAQTSSSQDVRALYEEATKAYKEKNYATFLEKTEAILKLRPHHQIYIYNLAAGYTLVGRKKEAVALLSRAAEMGFVYPDIEKDADFSSLRGTADFDRVLKKFAENRKPISHSETAFTVHEKGLVPEGLAYDPITRSFFLSSIFRRKILAVNQTGEARDFSNERDGLWSAFGMKVDASRHVLWVCTAAHRQMANAKPEEDGRTAIFKYDLREGKLIKRYPVPEDGQKHLLGDLTFDSAGNLYTSDSVSPAIYVIRAATDEIERFYAGPPFINPQGIALTPDEKRLLMADYLKGLFLIDLQTKEVTPIAAPPSFAILGIDGIYRIGNDLIAVQNGITPSRVIRLKLGDDFHKIEKLETLEANNPVFDEPTLGVVVEDRFYFIANSQWGAINEKGQLAPEEKLRDPIVLRLNL